MAVFEIRSGCDPDGVRKITVVGEIDIATAGQLGAAMEAAERDRPPALVLDLCNVTFIDSTGIRTIVEFDAVMSKDGRCLSIVPAPQQVQRVFELSGLEAALNFVGQRAQSGGH